MLRGAGEGLVMFGAGDVVLAVGDSFASTPFVDEAGRFQPPENFDSPAVAPSERWQIDAGVGVSVASQRRTETHYDVAVFRWLSPTLRMRYQLGADHGIDFSGDTTETYYGLGGGAQLEWNPARRRRHFGRHPHSALFALVLPRALLGEHRDAAFGWRASVGWELGPMMIGAGATQIVGDDRLPGGEVWFAIRPVATD